MYSRLPRRGASEGVPQGRIMSNQLRSPIRVDDHTSQVCGTPQRPTFGADFAAARVDSAMSRRSGEILEAVLLFHVKQRPRCCNGARPTRNSGTDPRITAHGSPTTNVRRSPQMGSM